MDIDAMSPVAAATKELAYIPSEWSESPYKNSTRLELVLPLRIDSVVQASVALRCSCLKEQPDRNLMMQVEIEPVGQRRIPIERFEWRPLAGHTNKVGPLELRFREFETHIHLFNDNAEIGPDAFQPYRNLPVARPVEPDPNSFQEALAVCAERLKIVNATSIPEPHWQYRMGI